MPSRITIVGSLNYDLVTFTDKVPEGGETYQANSFENHLGGKGLNEALAASRLNDKNSQTEVRMIGNIGNDSFGKELKGALESADVNTSYVKTIEGESSGVAVIIVEASGENRILITAGANGKLTPTNSNYEEYFPKNSSYEYDYVMLQNEYPDTSKTIDWIKSNLPKVNIAYNPSPFKPELINEAILSKVDFLIVNEGEALAVAKHILSDNEYQAFSKNNLKDIEGFKNLAKKLQKAINQQNISTIVITMGALGSVFTSTKIAPTFLAAQKVVNVVDTTGAGDTFFGGVISQLASGSSMEQAMKFATTASGLTIQKKGAAESIPTFDDVNKYL